MSILAALKPNGPSGFGYGSSAEDVTAGIDLNGKTILVTGASSGLGLETCRVLGQRGARVIGTGRSADRVQDALAGFTGDFHGLACELSDPASVRACVAAVKKEKRLDAIICNAGIMALPRLQQAFGIELQFFTNHIGHFILVNGLTKLLGKGGRIVMLSSSAHNAAPRVGIEFENLSGERGYNAWRAYGQSKLANILFAKELAKRLVSSGITVNAVHPGVIHTNLARSMAFPVKLALGVAGPLFLKTVAQGAATQTYVAVHPDASKLTGEYFADCNVAEPTAIAQDAALASRLWEESERIVARLPA